MKYVVLFSDMGLNQDDLVVGMFRSTDEARVFAEDVKPQGAESRIIRYSDKRSVSLPPVRQD